MGEINKFGDPGPYGQPKPDPNEGLNQVNAMLPAYLGLTNPDGTLKNQFQLTGQPNVGFTSSLDQLNNQLGGINLNTQGLEEIRKRALASGNSDWANLMLKQQGLNQMGQLDKAGATAKAGQASAFSALAGRGGLSAGARERVATTSMRDFNRGKADINRQGSLDQLGILTQDQQQKLGLLQGLPGMEVQALQPALQKTSMWSSMANSENERKQNLDLANRDYSTNVNKFNVGNLIGDTAGQNTYNMNKYSEQMKAWAAGQTADAQKHSGISWICTEINKIKPFAVGDLRALNELKRHALKTRNQEARNYLQGSDGLLNQLKAEGFDFYSLAGEIREIISLVKTDKKTEAVEKYSQLVAALRLKSSRMAASTILQAA